MEHYDINYMPHLFSPTFLPGGGVFFSIHFLHPFPNFSARFPQVMGKGPRIWRWSNVATATPKYHIDRCVPWQDRWANPGNEQLMVNAPENRQVIPEMNQLPNINFQGRTVSFGGTYTVDGWPSEISFQRGSAWNNWFPFEWECENIRIPSLVIWSPGWLGIRIRAPSLS